MSARTRQDDYGNDKTKPKPKPRPKPKPQPKSQLLSFNWQIVTVDKKGIEIPIDPNASDWSNVELARIQVQVNQPGYLYIVGQVIEKNNDLNQPQLIFSSGSNQVAKDSVIELPPTSQTRYKYNGKYWWKIAGSASRPIVTVFFCRAPLEELEKVAVQSRDKDLGIDYGVYLGLLQNTSVPKRKGLGFVKETSSQPSGFRNSLTPATQTLSRPQGLTGSFITISTSPNRNDDEVLAEIIEIKRR